MQIDRVNKVIVAKPVDRYQGGNVDNLKPTMYINVTMRHQRCGRGWGLGGHKGSHRLHKGLVADARAAKRHQMDLARRVCGNWQWKYGVAEICGEVSGCN